MNLDFLGNNASLVNSGFILVIGTAILNYFRDLPPSIAAFIKNRIVASIEITDKEYIYFSLTNWCINNTLWSSSKSFSLYENSDKESSIISRTGLHCFRYKGSYYFYKSSVERSREDGVVTLFRSIVLYKIFGTKQCFDSFITEFKQLSNSERTTVNVYKADYSYWGGFKAKTKRFSDSLILDKGVWENLTRDIDTFIGNRDWYLDKGVTYKRGYLFYGPPGSGKSSLAHVVASTYNLDLYPIDLKGINSSNLSTLFLEVPNNSLIVLEDIDILFGGDRDKNNDNPQVASLNTLLNCLDGLNSPENVLIFITTNHIETLDSALVRPGRVDYRQKLDYASSYQVSKLFSKFFPNDNSDYFESLLVTKSVSMASLLNYFLCYRNLEEIYLNVDKLE